MPAQFIRLLRADRIAKRVNNADVVKIVNRTPDEPYYLDPVHVNEIGPEGDGSVLYIGADGRYGRHLHYLKLEPRNAAAIVAAARRTTTQIIVDCTCDADAEQGG